MYNCLFILSFTIYCWPQNVVRTCRTTNIACSRIHVECDALLEAINQKLLGEVPHGVCECMMQQLHTPRESFPWPFVMLQLLNFSSSVLTVMKKLLGISTMAYRRQRSCAYCGINKIVATAKNGTAVTVLRWFIPLEYY